MTRQYLAIEFKLGSRRYTYCNDGEAVAIGDLVKVETRTGGQQIVTVADIILEEPQFECKPILGKHAPTENEDA